MKFQTWIDQQVADAERRGVFDNPPGKGKPLNLKPGAVDGDYGAQWARDYARREGVPVEDMLPTPLRLRREIERLAGTGGEVRTQAQGRPGAAAANARPPPRRAPRPPPPGAPGPAAAAAPRAAAGQSRPRRPRWWRRRPGRG